MTVNTWKKNRKQYRPRYRGRETAYKEEEEKYYIPCCIGAYVYAC